MSNLVRPLSNGEDTEETRKKLMWLIFDLRSATFTEDQFRLAEYLNDAIERIELLEPLDVITYLRSSFTGRHLIPNEWSKLIEVSRKYFDDRNLDSATRLRGLV